MRWLLVVALAACGGKKDEAPVTQPSAEVVDDAPPPAPVLVIDKAKQLLTSTPKRDPTAWIALAHAQHVHKHPDAKTTLDDALAAARADATSEGTQALVMAAEIDAALLDEAIERVKKLEPDDTTIGLLMSPVVALDNKTVVERLAQVVVDGTRLEDVVERVEPKTPAWTAIEEKVRALEDDNKRVAAIVILSRRASFEQDQEVAKKLIVEAAEIASKKIADYDAIEIASELALASENAMAKKLVAHVPRLAHSEEAAPRALTFARLAEIFALIGEMKESEGYEKKATIASEAADEELSEDDGFGGKVGDPVWIAIASARAKRKDGKGALSIASGHLEGKALGELAYVLLDRGETDISERVLSMMKPEDRWHAANRIVEFEAKLQLPLAVKRIETEPRSAKSGRPGLEHVLREVALAGNVGLLKQIDPKAEHFVDLAARTLARRNKCVEALAAIRDVKDAGEGLAVIARFCPDASI